MIKRAKACGSQRLSPCGGDFSAGFASERSLL